jgi:glycosyltransferase involved in cell wall biosynthesis
MLGVDGSESPGAQAASPSRKGIRSNSQTLVRSVVDMDCQLILPCRDEAPALPALLASVPKEFGVIVVDNGSTDATAAVAREHRAQVVHEPTPGYGAAVHAGLEAATAEFIAVADGDGSFDLNDLLPLLDDVRRGAADLSVGRRRPTSAGTWPWHARAGNALIVAWLRHRIDLSVHDIAPMRVCRRSALVALGVQDRRFGYPVELLQRATSAGWRITEHDVSYGPRAEGTRSKVSGSVSGTVKTARDFWKVLA